MVMVRVVYLGFLGEAEPGESHELFLTLGEGVLGVGVGRHAGGEVSCEATNISEHADGTYLFNFVWL